MPARAGRQSGAQILSRYSYRVPAGTRSSFATYFNAFPAAYWRRWTIVDKVTLRLSVTGSGSVFVYKSNARGASHRVESARVTGEELTFTLPLNTFGDGGWYWFDVSADEVRMGMRVRAVWTPESEWGHSIGNISHFAPTGEPDADYETYKDHL